MKTKFNKILKEYLEELDKAQEGQQRADTLVLIRELLNCYTGYEGILKMQREAKE